MLQPLLAWVSSMVALSLRPPRYRNHSFQHHRASDPLAIVRNRRADGCRPKLAQSPPTMATPRVVHVSARQHHKLAAAAAASRAPRTELPMYCLQPPPGVGTDSAGVLQPLVCKTRSGVAGCYNHLCLDLGPAPPNAATGGVRSWDPCHRTLQPAGCGARIGAAWCEDRHHRMLQPSMCGAGIGTARCYNRLSVQLGPSPLDAATSYDQRPSMLQSPRLLVPTWGAGHATTGHTGCWNR